MKTYTKKHTSRKVADEHLAKIKNRGGIGVMKVEKRGYTIDYYFPPTPLKTKSKGKGKNLYDVLDPDGRSIRRPGIGLFRSKKESLDYFDKWLARFHRHGYWSPNKGSIVASRLKRHCNWIVLKAD